MSWVRRHLAGLTVLPIGLAVGSLCIWQMRTQDGIGVSRADAPSLRLPADATNVTYHFAPPASYYDFDTSEAGFAEFVANWNLPWGEGSGRREPGSAWRWEHVAGQRVEVKIADGTFYGWWKEDAGRWLAYDHHTGRAYCSGHYR